MLMYADVQVMESARMVFEQQLQTRRSAATAATAPQYTSLEASRLERETQRQGGGKLKQHVEHIQTLRMLTEKHRCCFTAALLLLYCCFTAALLLLYC